MKRTISFVKKIGVMPCLLSNGKRVVIPIFQGIFKHPTPADLPALLKKPGGVQKYTRLSLAKAAWPVLREFPRDWLRTCMKTTRLPLPRRRALEFLLGK